MARTRAIISWSTGKDSAWALYEARRDPALDVVGLVTTVNRTFDRVAMHATRTEVARAQADALGLPLAVVEIPYPCPNEAYEAAMREALAVAAADGVEAIVFGDLFLADVRQYRVDLLARAGVAIEPLFPLWLRDTAALAREMVAEGLRAIVTCVDPKQAPRALAGRVYDERLLAELPDGVDPCGENGEFHTCVYAGPMFRERLPLVGGEIVDRDGFVFADVLPEPIL